MWDRWIKPMDGFKSMLVKQAIKHCSKLHLLIYLFIFFVCLIDYMLKLTRKEMLLWLQFNNLWLYFTRMVISSLHKISPAIDAAITSWLTIHLNLLHKQVSVGNGIITAHALMSLEARGTLFVTPGMEVHNLAMLNLFKFIRYTFGGVSYLLFCVCEDIWRHDSRWTLPWYWSWCKKFVLLRSGCSFPTLLFLSALSFAIINDGDR